MEDRNNFDALIDSALSTYSCQEPPLGMEVRVLRQVRERKQRRRLLFWVPAFVALSVVVLTLVHTPEPPPKPILAVSTTPVPPPMVEPSAPVATPSVRPRNRRRELTAQQEALLVIARSYPGDIANLKPHIPDDLSVAELEIKPLALAALEE